MAARTSGCPWQESRVSLPIVDPCEWQNPWEDSHHNFAKLGRMAEWEAGMPGSRSRVSEVEIAFLFERVWKPLPAAWLEQLLPSKHHFERAIIIHSLVLLLVVRLHRHNYWKMALPTHPKDDHVINWVDYECIFKLKHSRNVSYKNVIIWMHWTLSQYEQNKIKCWQNYIEVTKYHSQVEKHVCLLF